MSIVRLPGNRPLARFYRGGRRIAEFRGDPPPDTEFEPEDWVGSATPVAGEAPSGLTRLANGELLSDALAADAAHWLGPEHAAAYGADPMLLVKLLDAGQRLPVHAHPDGAWARRHLALPHGKTEAWYILRAGEVWLGLAHDLARSELDRIVAEQDTSALLALLNRVEVGPGDVVHVPAGVLHAIGEGVLMVEVQEPADLSVLAEWRGFAIDGETNGHLGIGYATALSAVEIRRRTEDDIAALVHRAGSESALLPTEAEAFFRLERIAVAGTAEIARGFAIGILLSGNLVLFTRDGVQLPLARGSAVLLPYAAGAVRARGEGTILLCRPPVPPALSTTGEGVGSPGYSGASE